MSDLLRKELGNFNSALEEYTHPVASPETVQEPSKKPAVSQSFLKSLVGFLRSKI